jgi:N-acyl-D-aspartate/D-glutamate deacylase
MGTMILSHGKIIDGLGNRPFVGHVLVKGDRIEAVLKENETLPPADTIIDASGCAIAPGFIDMHSHADWVLTSANHPKLLKCLLEQGITTIVAGNCGISPAPINPERLQSLMWHNVASVGYDAATKSRGYPNPAALGTFPKILGHYVREKKLFSIEKAIQRMTSASAQRFGIKDRGVLAPGKAADIVIFNPETVSETPPLNGKPAGKPNGILHVFVNGTQVVKDCNYIDLARAGQVLKL